MLDINMSQTRGKAFFAPVGASSVKVLDGSEKRIGIVFFGPNTGHITISNDNPAVLENGPTLSSSMGTVDLHYDIHGNIVKQPWYGIGSAAGLALGIIEILSG